MGAGMQHRRGCEGVQRQGLGCEGAQRHGQGCEGARWLRRGGKGRSNTVVQMGDSNESEGVGATDSLIIKTKATMSNLEEDRGYFF